MRPTTACLAKGFWSRSLDEFKRLSHIVFNLEGIRGPSGPLPLHSFSEPDSVKDCKAMSDQDIGGYSKATLDWVAPVAGGDPAHAVFRGKISTKLPLDRPEVQRSGYAGWRTLDRPPTLFGRSLWDIDSYAYLALRVRSDGRSYLVNVQTESIEPTDLHQHRLFAQHPGDWETVLIRWNDFVRTNHGFVVEPQTEMLRRRVRSIGVGLTDRVPGPFELCIERLWATNDPSEGHHHHQPHEFEYHPDYTKEGQLKNRQGKHISWNDE